MTSMDRMDAYSMKAGMGRYGGNNGSQQQQQGGGPPQQALQQQQQQVQQQGQPQQPPPLSPTGLQQQLSSLQQMYQQVGGMQDIGFSVRGEQNLQAQRQGTADLSGSGLRGGSGSLDQMAKNMAQRYGLNIGRGRLVDEYGNFLYTPEQLADASGGAMTMGEAAAKMNLISQALSRRQNEEQQGKGIAAIQTGMGQVQSRGRGSLAAMQSGMYQDLADLYSNQQYEAADFSYFIQREQQEIAMELTRRAEKLAERQARGQLVAGVGMAIAGIATGNVGLITAGGGMAAGSAGGTGWF